MQSSSLIHNLSASYWQKSVDEINYTDNFHDKEFICTDNFHDKEFICTDNLNIHF